MANVDERRSTTWRGSWAIGREAGKQTAEVWGQLGHQDPIRYLLSRSYFSESRSKLSLYIPRLGPELGHIFLVWSLGKKILFAVWQILGMDWLVLAESRGRLWEVWLADSTRVGGWRKERHRTYIRKGMLSPERGRCAWQTRSSSLQPKEHSLINTDSWLKSKPSLRFIHFRCFHPQPALWFRDSIGYPPLPPPDHTCFFF